jgi:hypothetical protein
LGQRGAAKLGLAEAQLPLRDKKARIANSLGGLCGRALYPKLTCPSALRRSLLLLSVGKPLHTEVEMAHKDGSVMWAQLIIYMVNPGRPGGCVHHTKSAEE